MRKKCTEERVPRQVIENQLLSALDDKSKVAILATKEDLEILIAALCGYQLGEAKGNLLSWKNHVDRCKEFASDLEQLKSAAFYNPQSEELTIYEK